MSEITPLSVKNELAGNPSGQPKFSMKVESSKGKVLAVSDTRAIRSMIALMDMQAVMGGAASHWGGPSALTELWSALNAVVFEEAKDKKTAWNDLFHLVNDAGHCENCLYAIKANYGFADLTVESLKGFRSIKSPLTGHGEAHLFPQGVFVSNGPLGSGVPQSQGLSLGDAIKNNSRVCVTTVSDGACMEGEAKEAFAAIPGLAAKGQMAPYVLIVSDNNTKLSGRIDEQSFDMTPTFESFSDLGWEVITLQDGNDLEAAVEAIEESIGLARSNPKKPVMLLAKTVKGYGVKKTAESANGGHGFPLKSPNELKEFIDEIYMGEQWPQELVAWCDELVAEAAAKKPSASTSPVPSEKVQVGVADALIELAESGLPIVSVTSDLPGSTGLAGFQKKFPENTIDVGIAESNMVNVATGLSKQGFIPIVDTFSQFGATKGALPFIMSSLSQGPMIAIFSHAGFQDAADGASHQSLNYISMLSSIPHIDTYVLSSSSEAKALISQSIEKFASDRAAGKTPNSSVFFLGRENFPRYYGESQPEYKLGEANIVFDSSSEFDKSVTIATCGPLVAQSIDAALKLKDKGFGAIVVNNSSINNIDINTIKSSLLKTNAKLLTVEDHQLLGGMGALLVHALKMSDCDFKLKSLGVNGEFGQSAYKASELYKKHGLDSQAIQSAVQGLLQ